MQHRVYIHHIPYSTLPCPWTVQSPEPDGAGRRSPQLLILPLIVPQPLPTIKRLLIFRISQVIPSTRDTIPASSSTASSISITRRTYAHTAAHGPAASVAGVIIAVLLLPGVLLLLTLVRLLLLVLVMCKLLLLVLVVFVFLGAPGIIASGILVGSGVEAGALLQLRSASIGVRAIARGRGALRIGAFLAVLLLRRTKSASSSSLRTAHSSNCKLTCCHR